MTDNDSIRQTLNERGSRYGRFIDHAGTARSLIRVVERRNGWKRLAVDQQHAISYILDKIARIIEGDPDYQDNWHDIAGYATLPLDRLNGTGVYATPTPNRSDVSIRTNARGQPIVTNEQSVYVPATVGLVGYHRCLECYAKLGDVHAPDCAFVATKDTGNPGGGAGS